MQAQRLSADSLSSKLNGLASDSQWAAKEGVSDLSLAQKMEAKVKLLKSDTRKVRIPKPHHPLQFSSIRLMAQSPHIASDLGHSVRP